MASDIIARGMASQGLDKVSDLNHDTIPAKWISTVYEMGRGKEITLDVSNVSIFNYENNNLTLQISLDDWYIWDWYPTFALWGNIKIYYNSNTYNQQFDDILSIKEEDFYSEKILKEWVWTSYYNQCSIRFTDKDGLLLTISNINGFSELKEITLYIVDPMLYPEAIPYDDKTIIQDGYSIKTASPLSVVLTQAEYDALTTKDKETLYFIKEE